VCVGEFRLFGPDPAASRMALGADLSFTPQELAAGARFTYRGRPASPVTIMRDNGANYVRMRLWVHPPAGYSDLASDLALARAVHAAGMKIYLDIRSTAAPVRAATRWRPCSRRAWPAPGRATRQAHRLLVMMHDDQGGNNTLSQAFYQSLVSRGVPFDVIGLSYYPFFHGAISQLRANVAALAPQFGKPIIVAGTQYPWTLANGDGTGNFGWQPSQLQPGYPASPGGQFSLVSDELSILAQVPHGLEAGLFYWEPEWIPGVGWEPGAGTPNDNLTLFSFQGAALPSIGIFRNPVAVCAGYDPLERAVHPGLLTGRQAGVLHRASSLPTVAQFRAVPVWRGESGPLPRASRTASSLRP
jgi:arabinogalactan endo-1,4-beta-galactosidase